MNPPEFAMPMDPGGESGADWATEFFQLSEDIFCVVNAQGIIQRVNPAFQAITGYAPGECVSRSFVDFIHEGDRAVAEKAFRRSSNGAGAADFECRCICKDEIVCWLACSCRATRTATDRFLIVGREITNRRALEAEFVEMTNRYEAAASASGSIAYEWNSETDELFWGGNFRGILGFASSQMAGTMAAWQARIHPEDRDKTERGTPDATTETKPIHLEYRVRCQDGGYIFVRDDARFYRDASGQPAKMIGSIQDITRQVQSQRQLQHVKGRLELILNSIGDGICGLDAQGRVTFVNPAAAAILGWSDAELIGKDFHATCHHSKKDNKPYPKEQCPIVQAIHHDERQIVVEDMFWRRDGSGFPVEYSVTRIRDADDVVGVVVTFRDITERHRRMMAEQELRTARTVQQLLYPDEAPQFDGFDIAGAAFPAAMACGDYFDFLVLDDGKLGIAVGDVSGHGLGPALHMVQARAFLRSTINSKEDEVGVLCRLNELLMQNRSDDFFLTLFLARLDSDSRILNYAGAGHEARLLRADGRIQELASTGIVLGVLDELRIENAVPTPLESGDVLLIATDGLMETYSPAREAFGWSRVLETLQRAKHLPAQSIIQRLKTAAQHFGKNRPQLDDVTIVVVKVL